MTPSSMNNRGMKELLSLFITFTITLSGLTTNSWACSIFMQPETGMVAKNFDWNLAEGEMMIRPYNAKKQALASNKSWISKYGSITFNQYGPDLPNGGMNTEGLLMEALILGATKHKELTPIEEAEVLNEAEFIQYNLDNYKSVEEVIQNVSELKVKKIHVPIHYFTCDISKQCAVIEFISGKVKVYTEQTLDLPILTNMAYEKVLNKYLQDMPSTSEAFSSYPRFKLLANFKMSDYSKLSMLEKLNVAKVTGTTVWQILYSPEAKAIDLLHIFSSTPVNVKLNKISFNCTQELKVLSLKDQDQAFSTKSIKQPLLKRIEGLKRVDENMKSILAGRPLRNNCQ
jgi:hypothetical protein